VFWRKKPSGPKTAGTPVLRCSFCNKTQHEVRKLIAGPYLLICDDCVEVCHDIVANDTRSGDAEDPVPWPAEASVIKCALCQLPMGMTDGVAIHARGTICAACVAAVVAAAARRS